MATTEPSSSPLAHSVPALRSSPHIFTIDVEEHFQVSAFEGYVDRDSWDRQPSRVERNMDVLLDMLAAHGATSTCFVLGWVAERHPDLVRRIALAGHEIASHGYGHRRVTTLSPAEFRADVRRSKALLESITGNEVRGYRAPSFSIVPGLEWAFDVLLEEGYAYDSSLFPIKRRGYGYPGSPPLPHPIERNGEVLWELPLTTLDWLGRRIPAAGGGYMRHFPFGIMRRAFRACSDTGVPGIFYVHPWELDPDQPRVRVGAVTRLRHYGGLAKVYGRIERLLREFQFTSAARYFERQGGTRPADGVPNAVALERSGARAAGAL
jgi:polysaccharide deacetylase family protein (PEP-CTERM system associated)